MLNLDNTRRYFVYQGVTDFRKGINGLCGIIRGELEQEPHCCQYNKNEYIYQKINIL